VGEHEHEHEPLDVGKIIRETFHDDGPFRLHVRSAREWAAMPDPPNLELLGPIVCKGSRTIVVGDTGHGKTTLCLQMLSAIVEGSEWLLWEGAGLSPVLVVDLEQGVRSIKRAIRETRLDERDDVLYVSVPDGLALDQERDHLLALIDVVGEYRPVVVLLDPYYKAHRADDPNAERPIIDLMRTLDSLRATYGFALILPAHPRKDVPGREGVRKLTLHDVAGSGAMTRGAEIVVAIERGNPGYARLRYLKDRDGDLPVNEALGMLYSKADGYRVDPAALDTDEAIQERILAETFGWLTTREVATLVKARHVRVREILPALAEQERLSYAEGPPGRAKSAKCYTTDPELREQAGTPTQLGLDTVGVPTVPPCLLRQAADGNTTSSEGDVGTGTPLDEHVPLPVDEPYWEDE